MSECGTLRTLGAQPARGRGFTEAEHENTAEGPAPVILTHAFWQRRFGGDEAVLGRALEIDSRPARVIGIMPPEFRFLDITPQPDLVLAAQLAPFGQLMITGGWGYAGLAAGWGAQVRTHWLVPDVVSSVGHLTRARLTHNKYHHRCCGAQALTYQGLKHCN